MNPWAIATFVLLLLGIPVVWLNVGITRTRGQAIADTVFYVSIATVVLTKWIL